MATRDDSLAKARLPAGTKSKGPLQSQRGAPVPAATEVVVIGFLALVACLVALGFLAEGVRDQEAFALDAVANPFLHTFASPALDMFMWAATTAGSNYVLPPLFVVAMVWLIAIKRRREAAFLAIASIGSLALNATMKVIFERPRPVLPWAQALPDFSFPSGHTMNSLVVYVALAIVLWAIYGRRVGLIALVVAIVLTVFIGISRIYLGFHYFTDVAAGALAGTGWLLVVGAAFQTGPFWRLWRDHGPTGSGTR